MRYFAVRLGYLRLFAGYRTRFAVRSFSRLRLCPRFLLVPMPTRLRTVVRICVCRLPHVVAGCCTTRFYWFVTFYRYRTVAFHVALHTTVTAYVARLRLRFVTHPFTLIRLPPYAFAVALFVYAPFRTRLVILPALPFTTPHAPRSRTFYVGFTMHVRLHALRYVGWFLATLLPVGFTLFGFRLLPILFTHVYVLPLPFPVGLVTFDLVTFTRLRLRPGCLRGWLPVGLRCAFRLRARLVVAVTFCGCYTFVLVTFWLDFTFTFGYVYTRVWILRARLPFVPFTRRILPDSSLRLPVTFFVYVTHRGLHYVCGCARARYGLQLVVRCCIPFGLPAFGLVTRSVTFTVPFCVLRFARLFAVDFTAPHAHFARCTRLFTDYVTFTVDSRITHVRLLHLHVTVTFTVPTVALVGLP